MTKLKHFFSSLPVEFYVTFVPSILISCILLSSLSDDNLVKATNYHLLSVIKAMVFTAPVLGNTFIYIFFYLVFRYLFTTFPVGANKHKSTMQLFKGPRRNSLIKRLLRCAFWIVTISIFLSMTALVVGMMSHFIAVERIIDASTSLMQFDAHLFGFYPPYAIQFLGFVEVLYVPIILAYVYTPFLLGCVGFWLLFADPTLFRKFLLIFTLSFFISFPIWVAYPAVTPNEMYRHNMFDLNMVAPIRNVVTETQISPQVNESINQLEKIWIDPNTKLSEKSISVTTMPSMHVVWGMEVALFAYYISRKLRYVALGYLVLNTLGTMLLLQHYAIDLIVGFGVGAAAFSMSLLLIWAEKKYFVDRLGLISALGVFRRDYLSVRNFLATKMHI